MKGAKLQKMRVPDFLIVGAMKCGTTTLYRDLAANPQIGFPVDKEVNNLAYEDVLTVDGRRVYADLFEHVNSRQICGEASTSYTMRPDFDGKPDRVEGVATRAAAVAGKNLKILYIVRDPIERIISHHYHDYRRGRVTADINLEVRRARRFIDYSRYAYQSEDWVRVFGRENFHVIDFHDYVADRPRTTEAVESFLGLPPGPPDRGENAHNQGAISRVELTPFWAGVRGSRPYQSVRRRIPLSTRERLRGVLLPSPPPPPPPPSPETVRFLLAALEADLERQAEILQMGSLPWTHSILEEKHLGVRGN